MYVFCILTLTTLCRRCDESSQGQAVHITLASSMTTPLMWLVSYSIVARIDRPSQHALSPRDLGSTQHVACNQPCTGDVIY